MYKQSDSGGHRYQGIGVAEVNDMNSQQQKTFDSLNVNTILLLDVNCIPYLHAPKYY